MNERDEMRQIAMNVFNEMIGPIRDKVTSTDSRMRSLYSNGSGGPPGYLEMARAEDKEWQKNFAMSQSKAENKRMNRINLALVIIGLILAYLTLRVEMKKTISEIASPQNTPQMSVKPANP